MNLNIEDVKKITELAAEDFRVHHGKLTLSLPKNANILSQVIKSNIGTGFIILIVGDYTANKNENDLEVAKKCFALNLAEKLNIKCSPKDF